ncbi:MAG: SpoIID/LytB domain-containing protein [Acidobacteriales bacterium]|nr:SpoIID/LytB domain-containing protein [Terriglobales bacterium]
MRTSLLVLLLSLCATAQTVKIGVLGLFKPQALELTPAPHQVLVFQGGTRRIVVTRTARVEQAGEAVRLIADGKTRSEAKWRVTARDDGPAIFTLAVPGRIHRTYTGVLTIESGKSLEPVVEMDVERAVASAVAAESPPNAPVEALKAQAVVSRSYFLAAKGRHANADLCDTTHCIFLGDPPGARHRATQATEATRGQVLRFGDQTLLAMFSASCGGRTQTLSATGGTPAPDRYPYYTVESTYCLKHPDAWHRALPKTALTVRLNEKTEAARLAVVRRLGWSTVPSTNYEMRESGGRFLLEGTGHGHGLGLCERGAEAMAREGAGYQRILSYYYPNTRIETVVPAP